MRRLGRWFLGGVLLLLPTVSRAQAPASPTCEQRLAAVFGQYTQSIAANGEREAGLRAEYERQIAALQEHLKALQPKPPAPPDPPAAKEK